MRRLFEELNIVMENFDELQKLRDEWGWNWRSLSFYLECVTHGRVFGSENVKRLYGLAMMVRKVRGNGWRYESSSVRNG